MEMEEGMVDAPIPGDSGFEGSLQVPSNSKDSVICVCHTKHGLKYMLLKHACIWSRFFYTCPHVKTVLNYSFLYSPLEQFEDIVLACRQP